MMKTTSEFEICKAPKITAQVVHGKDGVFIQFESPIQNWVFEFRMWEEIKGNIDIMISKSQERGFPISWPSPIWEETSTRNLD